jgi:hypothetical protein
VYSPGAKTSASFTHVTELRLSGRLITLTLILTFSVQRQLFAVGWLVGLNFNPKPKRQ